MYKFVKLEILHLFVIPKTDFIFILLQPRLLMAMARDGLLPSFFSDISTHTQVPVKSTVTAGTLAAALAFFMDVSQLSGMVS